MILSDKTIMAMLGEGSLAIFPIESGQIQPASVDIRLGTTFSVVEDTSSGIISMDNQISYKTIQTERYLLLPGQFVLATTMEYISLPNDLTAFVEGRSSLGRMGSSSRMRDGSIQDSRERSHWNYLTPTVVP